MTETLKLEDITFPLLLKDALESKFSGIMFASSNGIRKGLIFLEGRLCAIQSNKPDELLGNMLLERGNITAEQNTTALRKAQIERRRQGEVLLEMEVVTEDEIEQALREQLEKRFLDIFSWGSGQIQRIEKDGISKKHMLAEDEFKKLIRAGIMEHLPFSSVISALTPLAEANPKRTTEHMPPDVAGGIDDLLAHNVYETLSLEQPQARTLLALYCTGLLSFEESAHKDVIDRLKMMFDEIKDADPYDVLGVDKNISEGGLKRAYIKLVKTNHPDAYSYADDPEVKKLANNVFTLIQDAYNEIKRIREGRPPEDQGEGNELQAELIFVQATQAIKQKDYQKACDLLKLCIKISPDHRVYNEAYIKTIYQKWQKTGRGNSLEIKSAVKEALKRFRESDQLHLVLGWVFAKEGADKRAMEEFKQAVRINPNNQEARREMRIIEARTTRRRS